MPPALSLIRPEFIRREGTLALGSGGVLLGRESTWR